MKKKLALLLASVMALSTVSVNIFANSENTLSKSPVTVPEKTVFVEQGNDNLSVTPGRKVVSGSSIYAKDAKTDNLKYLVEGSYLKIKLEDDMPINSVFTLELNNAEWFFRNYGAPTTITTEGIPTNSGNLAVPAFGGAVVAGSPVDYNFSDEFTKNYGDKDDPTGPWFNFDHYNPNLPNRAVTNLGNLATFDMSKGFIDNQKGTLGIDYTRTTYLKAGVDTFVKNGVYTLTVSNADAKRAQVKVNMALNKGDYLHIPLVVRTKEAVDASVRIIQDQSIVKGQTLAFSITSATLTKTYVDDPKEARNELPINKLIIAESRIGSMKSGYFEIAAPSGFVFKKNFVTNLVIPPTIGALSGGYGDTATAGGDSSYVSMAAEGGLKLNGWFIKYKDVDGDIDESVLQFYVNLTQSTLSQGRLYLTNLVLVADEDAAFGDVNLKIKNLYTGFSEVLTNETFKAGTRTDWTITLTTKGDIPTLITGRYNSALDSANSDDDTHLAATVVFKENSVSAWWAERKTELSLSDGAKIRKLKITEAKEMYQDSTVTPKIDMIYDLKNSGVGSIKIPGLGDSEQTFGGDQVIYPNDAKIHNFVKIDGNTITMQNLKIQKDEKAYLEMKLWISVAANFKGDVKITAAGTAVPDKLEPVVIAHTIQPITIDTKVTDIKIGYQYYKVADFTIKETKAGMLQKGKEVRISISDAVSSDMAFTPGFKHEETGFKIKEAQIVNGTYGTARSYNGTTPAAGSNLRGGATLGQVGGSTYNAALSFVINQASTTNAGSVKFSNVQVKIDRTVPESSVPYDIIVWGTAIAENYGLYKDQFQIAGISAPYVKVVTSANDKGGILANIVKVTIGDPVITVGPTTVTMDTAAYVSTTSESTMVPVRFISVALGVPDSKVNWDPNKSTVTIDASQSNSTRIIQMTTGSDQILINGISQTMYSPNMTPVKMEIQNERSFVPMRALGEALGVQTAWDAETKTATYNADKDVAMVTPNAAITSTPATTAPATTTPATTTK